MNLFSSSTKTILFLKLHLWFFTKDSWRSMRLKDVFLAWWAQFFVEMKKYNDNSVWAKHHKAWFEACERTHIFISSLKHFIISSCCVLDSCGWQWNVLNSTKLRYLWRAWQKSIGTEECALLSLITLRQAIAFALFWKMWLSTCLLNWTFHSCLCTQIVFTCLCAHQLTSK